MRRRPALPALALGVVALAAAPAYAAESIRDLIGGSPETFSVSLRILLLLTILTLAPSIVLLGTSFLRISIVLSFVRRALGTQEVPPNQVIIGLALALTALTMAPTWSQISRDAIVPYASYQIGDEEAFERGARPLRAFMLAQMERSDLALFVRMAGIAGPEEEIRLEDVPTHVVVCSFVTSELKRSFKMGFLIYLPFLVIDLVVASVLISMGMLVLPPILISLPFKILIFVLVDGWGLVVGRLVESFARVAT
ncbi:MAG: flagellar type III secretion system pore protein FliP [Planctomycetes bacterium]|nr:flagellar type III secretion system pore protein FliP [Planctomycetota bacterium]